MDDVFKIYVGRLQTGKEEAIAEELAPDFIEVDEENLSFPEKISLQGKTYLAEDELVMQIDAQTVCKVPCSVCNEEVAVPVKVDNFYHVQPIKEIKGAVFDYSALLREAILLDSPDFVECHNGTCPERKGMESYLSTGNTEEKPADDGYHPFSDLELN